MLLAILLLALHGALCAQGDSASLAALMANPREDSAEWHRKVGHAHYRAGSMQQTLDHLQKAIRLEPGNEQYYLDLGEVLAHNNAREAVVAVFEAARTAVPDSLRIRSALGVAYLTMRDYEKAKQSFIGLIEARPGDETSYQLLAECYDITQDWENTGKTAARLRALNPKNSHGWYYGASAEFGIRRQTGGTLETAETQARKAAELALGDWRPHLLLGKLLAANGRGREAVTALKKAIALKSDDPQTYYLLAQTLKRLGQSEESAQAFKAYEGARANRAASQRKLLVDLK